MYLNILLSASKEFNCTCAVLWANLSSHMSQSRLFIIKYVRYQAMANKHQDLN